MKMAKASEADLDMAMKLVNYLDSIERRQMPDDLSEDDESIEWLDYRDTEQYAKLIDGLCRLLNQGSISRVVFGMYVVCDPANKCLDPDADTLELHPELEKAAEQRDELLAAAELVLAWYEAEEDHSKEPDFYKRVDMCRESEIAIRAAIAKVKP
jgi:hypothetical protein